MRLTPSRVLVVRVPLRGPLFVALVVPLLIALGLSNPLRGTEMLFSPPQESFEQHLADRPFLMPSTAALRASGKPVFAHYFVPFPVSLDNVDPSSDYYAVNYLQPSGENGKFAASGGFIRERPWTRPPRGESNWTDLDLRDEVTRAVSAGLDGFTCDILDSSGTNWARELALMDAAAAVDPGFKIVIMPDMSAEFAASPENLVPAVLQLAAKSAAYRLADGRLLLAPFDAEMQSVSWWQATLATLAADGVQVAFWPCFVNPSANMAAFAPICYGVGGWGARAVIDAQQGPNFAAQAHAAGVKWMGPVAPQDSRPKDFVYSESSNTGAFRAMWNAAINNGSDAVQITTWNDYSEASEISPASGNGYTWLDLASYYTAWYKTGSPPPITSDAIYFCHRIQQTGLTPTVQTQLFSCVDGTPSDQAEMIAFLTQPAQLEIDVGAQVYTQNSGAGLVFFLAPLAPGKITFKINRAGTATLSVVSPWQVQSSVEYQDMLYRTGSISSNQSTEAASATSNSNAKASSGCGMGSSAGLILGAILLWCAQRRLVR